MLYEARKRERMETEHTLHFDIEHSNNSQSIANQERNKHLYGRRFQELYLDQDTSQYVEVAGHKFLGPAIAPENMIAEGV